ncbi:MAG: hypothetical protein Q7R35_09630 [Elusimicrobiota bacterium]|nr:hypothetical protein [Elusimicrobiota bacterium]
MRYSKAIAALVILLSISAALVQIEKRSQISETLHIYIPCSSLTKALELTVLIDGKVAAEKTLRYGGPQPCIDEITVNPPAGPHELLVRSGVLGNSAARKFSMNPGENWIVISLRRAPGGSWEWDIEQHTARPKFS